MATEALDLPRDLTITIRLPHRLRVLLRAMRIGRARRRASLVAHVSYFDDCSGRARYTDRRYDWLSALVLQQGRGGR